MSDLVKRLREASSSPARDAMGIGEHWNLEDEAADAIERKDAAIADLQNLLDDRSVSTGELIAEISRSHAAIAELLDICKNVVERGIGGSDIRAMKAAIAKYDIPKVGA